MSKVYYRKIANMNADIDVSFFNSSLKSHIKRKDSFLAYLLLKEIVLKEYNIDIRDVKFFFNEHGKPLCDNFYFNISHSKDYVAVGISKSEIGIDIQYIDNNKDYSLVAKRLGISYSNNEEFIKRFTILEAYYKKIGTGIFSSNVKDNNIDNTSIVINNSYALAVCADDEVIINRI